MSQWHTVATVGLIICPQAPGGLGYTIYCKSPRIKNNCKLRYIVSRWLKYERSEKQVSHTGGLRGEAHVYTV